MMMMMLMLLMMMTMMLMLMMMMMTMTLVLMQFCRYVTPILDKLRAGECCKQPESGMQIVDAHGNPITPQQLRQQQQQQQLQNLDADVAAEASRIKARNGDLTDILELHRSRDIHAHHHIIFHQSGTNHIILPSSTASPKYIPQPLKSLKKSPSTTSPWAFSQASGSTSHVLPRVCQ